MCRAHVSHVFQSIIHHVSLPQSGVRYALELRVWRLAAPPDCAGLCADSLKEMHRATLPALHPQATLLCSSVRAAAMDRPSRTIAEGIGHHATTSSTGGQRAGGWQRVTDWRDARWGRSVRYAHATGGEPICLCRGHRYLGRRRCGQRGRRVAKESSGQAVLGLGAKLCCDSDEAGSLRSGSAVRPAWGRRNAPHGGGIDPQEVIMNACRESEVLRAWRQCEHILLISSSAIEKTRNFDRGLTLKTNIAPVFAFGPKGRPQFVPPTHDALLNIGSGHHMMVPRRMGDGSAARRKGLARIALWRTLPQYAHSCSIHLRLAFSRVRMLARHRANQMPVHGAPVARHDSVCLLQRETMARRSGRHPRGSGQVSCSAFPFPLGIGMQASALMGRPLGQGPATTLLPQLSVGEAHFGGALARRSEGLIGGTATVIG